MEKGEHLTADLTGSLGQPTHPMLGVDDVLAISDVVRYITVRSGEKPYFDGGVLAFHSEPAASILIEGAAK